MKKIWCWVSALLLVSTLIVEISFPISAEIVSGYCGGESDGGNVTWVFSSETGVLTISGEGAMGNWKWDSNYSVPWDAYREQISTVIIEDGITTVGDYSFSACTKLTNISMPDSIIVIGNNAFYGCSNLTNITIPDSVITIDEAAFYSCGNLTSITIPSSVAIIGERAFSCCINLSNLVVSSENPVYHSDKNCIIETNRKILVAGCQNSIIPTDGSVTTIGDWAFYRCVKLFGIVIPDSIEKIGAYAFEDCIGLFNVTIGNNVVTIGKSAFYNCSGLSRITIPNSVATIGEWAFGDCNSLTHIMIPDSVTTIEKNAFGGCDSLNNMMVSDGNPVYHSDKNCIIETSRKLLIAGCNSSVIPTDGSVTSIGDNAFYYCSSITNITIPDCITVIGSDAFSWCTSLTHLNIESNVTIIGDYAFYYCNSLTSVVIPDSVIMIGEGAFRNCRNLTNVTIPNSITVIGYGAFSECPKLNSISLSNGIVTIGHYAFAHCNLNNIMIPNSVTTIGDYAFYNCNLKTIIIPTSVGLIGNYAFSDCQELTNIVYCGTEAQWNEIEKGADWDLYTSNYTITYHIEHVYDSDLDDCCNVCNMIREISLEESTNTETEDDALAPEILANDILDEETDEKSSLSKAQFNLLGCSSSLKASAVVVLIFLLASVGLLIKKKEF